MVTLHLGSGTSQALAGPGGIPIGGAGSRPTPTTSVARGDPSVAARRAIDIWLDALVHSDPETMLSSSAGAAAAYGSLQLVSDEIIRARGGSNSTAVARESITPRRVAPGAVEFAGEINLTNTVTGPKGSAPTYDRLDGPIRVVEQNGRWRLANFEFDGRPIVYYPEGLQDTVDGIHLTVGFLLSYSDVTVALVSLSADAPNTTITITGVSLTLASGTREAGGAQFARDVPTGMLGFRQVTAAPTRLDVSARLNNGTTITLSVSLLRAHA